MRKEIVFAIVFGSILGLIVAFGIWRVNSALAPKEKSKEAEASPTPKADFLVSLAKPENNDVISASPFEITGLTKPGATIAVSAESNDYVTDANNQGLFAERVSAVGGVNQILVTAFDEGGNPTQTSLLVVFSSEFAKIIENLSTPAPATNEADTVREKVQEKVTEALNKPKAYLGLITDISESTIQIKSQTGEIAQVATAADTAYVDTDPMVKTVTAKDVAIGDFIVAMGFSRGAGSGSAGKNGNQVLNAKRILIIPPLEDVKRKVLMGKVVKTTAKDFVIAQTKDQQAFTITPQKTAPYFSRSQDKFVKSKFADVKEGSEVVIFGIRGEKSFSARTIFLLTN